MMHIANLIAKLVISPASLLTVAAIAGPLSPTGPVAPTYKTLTEVEPRIAISSTNTPGDATSLFKITQPGSYYLTGNITGVAGKHGIVVDLSSAGAVVLDLKGYTLVGVPGSLSGFFDIFADFCGFSNGAVSGWGGAGISASGQLQLSDVGVESDSSAGCVVFAGGASQRELSIRDCTLRSTEGPLVTTAAGAGMVTIEGSSLSGNGCATTSLLALGGTSSIANSSLIVINSSFSGPVIDQAYSNGMIWDVPVELVSGSSAPSLMRIGCSGTVRTENMRVINSTFTTAIVDVTAKNVTSGGLKFVCEGTTSAPTALRIASGFVGTVDIAVTTGVPIGIDMIGSNNSLSGDSKETSYIFDIPAGGTGIRMSGNANTIKGCRISGSGVGAVTGVQINAGATNNLIVNSEFVRLNAGSPVNNLGGGTNSIAPLVTNANLGAATNPFSNFQH